MIAHDSCAQIASDHDGSIVDEELNRLPERYRLPLYLCCIEGKSLEVAARQLNWSVGSVKGRLERGRSELRRRLLLRRVTPAFGLAALAMLTPTAQAATASGTTAVAPSLIASTVQAGMQHAVGRSALGYVSQNALQLTQGSWKIMSLTTLKITVCSITMTGLLTWGGSYRPTPAAAEGTGSRGIVLEATLPISSAYESQLALAEGDEKKPEGRREGDKPAGARDGDKPRTGPRDGDAPKTGAREGDAPRRPAEGERSRNAVDPDRPNPLEGFKPQNEREEVLVRMIMQLQGEIAMLRRNMQVREGAPGVRREGGDAGPRREGDGDKPRTGAREGDKPRTGAREGDAPKPGAREGDAPKKE